MTRPGAAEVVKVCVRSLKYLLLQGTSDPRAVCFAAELCWRRKPCISSCFCWKYPLVAQNLSCLSCLFLLLPQSADC